MCDHSDTEANPYTAQPRPADASRVEPRAASCHGVELSVHDDLAAVERDWRDLEQRGECTVFQSFSWLTTWQLHVGERRRTRPVIVIGRDAAGDTLFLLPLSVERGLLRQLMWLGSQACDYNAPLLGPAFGRELGSAGFLSLWPQILDLIQGQPGFRFDLIHFERMPQRVGSQENPFVQLPVTPHRSCTYLTNLAADWETFYSRSRSSATRRRDRRKRERLGGIGEVRFVTARSAEEAIGCVDVLIAQKTRWFAASGVPNIFRRPGYTEFYRAMAANTSSREMVHVSRLDVGPTPAAAGFGLKFGGTYHLVLTSYDDGELSRFSPGAAHLHELFRFAIESGCEIFDFTVGDEPYKRDWTDVEFILFDHVMAARWSGALVARPLIGMIRLKRTIKQTPSLWNAFSKARAFLGTLTSRWRSRPP